MPDRMDTCSACRFFNLGAGLHECRRRAPIHADRSYQNPDVPTQRIPEYWSEWPIVAPTDWCGEFEARRGS